MKQRTLTVTLFVVATFLIVANVLMMRWRARLPYYQKLEDIRLADSPNVLFIGNSLLDERVDAKALRQGSGNTEDPVKPLDAALGGSDPYVQALLMDYSLRCHPELRTLVIGFFDFQLTAQNRPTPADLTGNAAVAIDSRFPLREVDEVYGFDTPENLEIRFLRAVPMIAYRKNAWKYVEFIRRYMEEMGMPHAAMNINGRASDFSNLEAGTPLHFDEEVQESLSSPRQFNASYEKIFSKANSNHMRVVLIVMPMSPLHQDIYYSRTSWKKYLAVMCDHLRQKGFDVIDASEWMQKPNQFVDSLHMSSATASEFSFRLGQELERRKLRDKKFIDTQSLLVR